MIDLHSHILPGLDDGAQTWEESLLMARLAADDGIRVVVATPHLFKERRVDVHQVNEKDTILECLREFRARLAAEAIPLEILPGCDVPLCLEALQFLENDLLLTINDARRYLLLELPDTAIPPATREICFRIKSQGITPIITHPERHLIIQEAPEKLKDLLDLGCLAQITAASLTGRFGRQVVRTSKKLVKKGYVQLMATDAHNCSSRPPLLTNGLKELANWVGKERARAMVIDLPEKIIRGEVIF